MGMQGGTDHLQSEINVTPMVDIMLVLLLIFMVVTPFLQQGITVAIPRDLRNPDEDQAINKESSVIISVPRDGEYYMGKNSQERQEFIINNLKVELDLIDEKQGILPA